MAGEGSDELFAGYDYYSRINKAHLKLFYLGSLLKYGKFLSIQKLDRAIQLYKDYNNLQAFYLKVRYKILYKFRTFNKLDHRITKKIILYPIIVGHTISLFFSRYYLFR